MQPSSSFPSVSYFVSFIIYVDLTDGIVWISIIGAAVLTYEYFLTLSIEIERFWSAKRLTWAIFFFFFNRYFTLLGHIPLMVEHFLHFIPPSKLTVSLVVSAEVEFRCNQPVE